MTNPYSASETTLHAPPAAVETYQPKMFQWRGRIGRLRYLAYSLGLGLVTTIPLLIVQLALLTEGSVVFWVVQALIMILSLGITIVLGRRRLNDMGYGGWQLIGAFIPLVNLFVFLWMIFAPGEAQPNQYGPVPGPNTRGITIAALAMPVLVIVGLVAAFSFGAYSGLQQQRANTSSQSF